ncbi:hypothetical protein SLS60_004289 [Paraconiothyrium brasiliense]|uniref:Uncharacterized protein n=1 Tax=Paraconiothyrium brasiliense TaxID=300254 RepID=A0ABR3RJW6_9PLEO
MLNQQPKIQMSTNATPEFAAIKHWSLFGRQGTPSAKRATAESWKHTPFQKPVTKPWNQVIPRDDLPKLLNGSIPEQMEDKWFVYAEGPDGQGNATLHFHRSWTGSKMVEAKLVIELNENGEVLEKDARFTEVTWETDKERYNGDMDAPGMVLEVLQWCMGCKIRPPTTKGSESKDDEDN